MLLLEARDQKLLVALIRSLTFLLGPRTRRRSKRQGRSLKNSAWNLVCIVAILTLTLFRVQNTHSQSGLFIARTTHTDKVHAWTKNSFALLRSDFRDRKKVCDLFEFKERWILKEIN